MTGERLDLRAQVGVPQSNSPVLAPSQDILCRALGIARDVDRALVAVECDMEVAREGL